MDTPVTLVMILMTPANIPTSTTTIDPRPCAPVTAVKLSRGFSSALPRHGHGLKLPPPLRPLCARLKLFPLILSCPLSG